MDFKQLASEYLDYCRADQQPQWVEQKTRIIQRMGEYFTHPLESITPATVSNYIQQRTKVTGARTINNDISILRSLFNYAQACGYIPRNPMTLIKRIKAVPTEVEVYTLKEIDRIISMAKGNNRKYLTLIKNTLARVGEINRLKWEDVDLSEGIIWLGRSRSSTKPRRCIPLNKQAREVLLQLSKAKREDGYVFGYHDKRRMLKRLCNRTGTKYRGFHAIRKGVATALMEGGAHVKHISDVLGHRNLQNTQYYLKSSDKAIRDTMTMLE